MKDYLFLDLETFSERDLKNVGSYAYAEHPSTEIMLVPYAIGDGPERVYDATSGNRPPKELMRALRRCASGKMKLVGQNFLMFDRPVLSNCWGIAIPPEHIIDTMVEAYRYALPGSLEKLCEVLNIPVELAKDKAGKALIQRFCKPTPKNYKIRRYTKQTHPEEWKRFVDYARRDITSMREAFYRLPTWNSTEIENRILVLDQIINDRGFYVDTELARCAVQAIQEHKKELKAEAMAKYGSGLTGADFLPALRDLAPAHAVPNAQKAVLLDLLEDPDLPDEARVIIEMRLGAASTASTKYKPLIEGLSADGRRRGCLQYGGAKRTLRWAGRGFQPQNLARGYYHDDPEKPWPKSKDLSLAIESLLRGKAENCYDIAKLTASTVRSCIIAAEAMKLVVADYANVEGRGLAWLAGEESVLETFRAGKDVYCMLAVQVFGVAYDDVNSMQRQACKAMILGLGYGGGVAAFCTFAKTVSLDLLAMTELLAGTFPDHIWAAARRGFEYARIQEAKKKPKKGQLKADRPSYDLPKKVWMTCDSLKRLYREANPNIVKFWSDLEIAVKKAVADPGQSYWAGAPIRENGDRAIRIVRTTVGGKAGWWLKIELPSGRFLSYPGVGISVERDPEDPDAKPRTRIRYLGENQTTRQWEKQYSYGGKLAENVTQAICRDMLAWSMLNVEAAGYKIILSVHDEILTEVPDKPKYSVKRLCELMCDLPEWAESCPITAEGWEGKRYRK